MATRHPSYTPDLFAPEAIPAPWAHYEALRGLGPLVWLEASDCWATTTHAAAHEVLHSPDLYQSGRGVSLNEAVNKVLVGSTLNSDAPDHGKRKRVSIRPLMPASLKPLEPTIAAASEALVAGLPTEVEAISTIARHLPLTIVTELVGLPKGREADMLTWASATFNFMGPDNALARAHAAGLKDLRAFIEDPDLPQKLKPEGWAAALFAAEQQGKIPTGWAREQLRDYLNPSLDTTIAAIGYGLWRFAESPDQWDLLRQNPSLIPNAVEEIVRLCTPIRGLSRHVTQDMQALGVDLKQGDRIWVLFASANRDPDVFQAPDTFDISRQTLGHMGFGAGPHFCLGMHLARMEMRNLLLALSKKVRRFHLAGEPKIGQNNIIYGLEALPMRLEFALD